MDNKGIQRICELNAHDLAISLDHLMRLYHYERVALKFDVDGTFLYSAYAAESEHRQDKVCVMAHLDTVGLYDKPITIMQAISDPDDNGLYFHNMGGCFDDRAGVIGILDLIGTRSVYPYVIFTGLEESGCGGAIELIDDYPELDMLFQDNNIQCLIQLDRHGSNDVVFYDLEYPEFEKIFTRYFTKQPGSWTDIAVIAPYWNIAAANISVGYYYEHTPAEVWNYAELKANLLKLEKIIREFYDYKREDRWEYRGGNGTMSFLLGPQVDWSTFFDETKGANLGIPEEFLDKSVGEIEKNETSKKDK